MIPRATHAKAVARLLKTNPVVALLGARQVGKTTLASDVARQRKSDILHLDLEDPAHLARLADPMLALESRRGLVVLDEVQHHPELFASLRVLADRPRTPCRFLVLGSASPELLRQSSESLAGRIAYHELTGFTLDELGASTLDRLWLRGGFPKSFLARTQAESRRWREDFIRTFVERDLPRLGFRVPAQTLRRFWSMLAHYHGQIWNASEFGRSLGANDKTAKHYLDILCSTYLVRQLRPWHENLGKRQVKSPKIYLTDSGLLHSLLGIRDREDLEGHPKIGASWECFIMHQIIKQLGAQPDECYFWATHSGAELDLLIVRGRHRMGFEFKRTTSPSVTKSMHTARELLGLRKLTLVHAGKESYPIAKGVQAVSAHRILDEIAPLR